MNVVLVWVLIISSMGSSTNEVEQLGPYAYKTDCVKVQNAIPIRDFRSQCIQVNMVFGK